MATVNVRCPNPNCAWVGRSRPVTPDVIGLGAGVFGMLQMVCECGTPLECEVVSMGIHPVVARIPKP